MLSLTAKTQIDKARHALRDAVAYADEVVRDERLRADIRAAVGHGTKASDRLRKEIDAGGISARLTSDAKLRKNLRAMLDDLDSAGQRMRRKKGHRARSVLLVIAGAGAVVAAISGLHHVLAQRTVGFDSGKGRATAER